MFGDPTGAVALDAEETLDRGGPESLGDLQLDERHDRHLVLAKPVIGRRLGHADRFADDHQQLERDPGPVADLLERLGGEGGEPLVAGRVEEVERQGTAPDGSAHTFERDPGILERSGHQHAAHVARREAIRLLGGQDAEIHQSNEVVRLDPGSLGSAPRVSTRSLRPAYCGGDPDSPTPVVHRPSNRLLQTDYHWHKTEGVRSRAAGGRRTRLLVRDRFRSGPVDLPVPFRRFFLVANLIGSPPCSEESTGAWRGTPREDIGPPRLARSSRRLRLCRAELHDDAERAGSFDWTGRRRAVVIDRSPSNSLASPLPSSRSNLGRSGFLMDARGTRCQLWVP